MTLSEEFIESICEDDLQKAILLILRDTSLNDSQKIEKLVKIIREEKK